MKPEYLEPWKQSYPTKNELTKAWADWFESKTDDWDLFTMTVVFKSGGKVARPDRWSSENHQKKPMMKHGSEVHF